MVDVINGVPTGNMNVKKILINETQTHSAYEINLVNHIKHKNNQITYACCGKHKTQVLGTDNFGKQMYICIVQ